MTFHTFYAKPHKGQTPLVYDSEATWEDIVESVLHDPVRPKIECPAIVLNRFKADASGKIRNKYSLLQYTSGWFGIDVDNAGPLTRLVKKELITIQDLRLIWISSSGVGVKAIGYNESLVGVPPSEFTYGYKLLMMKYQRSCNLRINFDMAMSRCHQPIFINSDPKAFIR